MSGDAAGAGRVSSGVPRVVRTKTTELAVTGENRFHLTARLTDTSYDCAYAGPADRGVIHDFTVEGDLEGEDLVITDLHADERPGALLPRHQGRRTLDRGRPGTGAEHRRRLPRAGAIRAGGPARGPAAGRRRPRLENPGEASMPFRAAGGPHAGGT